MESPFERIVINRLSLGSFVQNPELQSLQRKPPSMPTYDCPP